MIRVLFVMQVNADAHEGVSASVNPIYGAGSRIKTTARITTRFILIRSAICCSPPLRLNLRKAERRCQHRRSASCWWETYATLCPRIRDNSPVSAEPRCVLSAVSCARYASLPGLTVLYFSRPDKAVTPPSGNFCTCLGYRDSLSIRFQRFKDMRPAAPG